VTIKKEQYIQADELFEHAPIYCKKSRSTRVLMKNKEVPNEKWIFGKPSQKNEDKWISSDGASAKCDKVFIKYDYVMNIKEIQKKMNPVVEETNDDEITEAPDVIELEEHEKFKSIDNNIVEIETRGERNAGGAFFKVSDVSDAFDMSKLQDVLVMKNTSYKPLEDYKYFLCKNPKNVGKKTSKNKFVKKLFLTYGGMLHVLFASHNDKTEPFRKWASNVLFTVQMGTVEQKQILSSDILGVPFNTLKEVFNKNTNKFSAVYLFTFGTVKDLRKSMNIDDKYNDNDIICKFGLSEDLGQRAKDHQRTYGKIKNVDIKLKYYSYVDPDYTSNAEADVRQFVSGLDWNLKYEKFTELIVLPKKNMTQIKVQYELIGKKYAVHCDELKTQLIKKDNDILMMKKDHEIDMLKKDNHIDILKKDYALIQKDNELLQLKLQISEHKN